jgi:hypothetical protein
MTGGGPGGFGFSVLTVFELEVVPDVVRGFAQVGLLNGSFCAFAVEKFPDSKPKPTTAKLKLRRRVIFDLFFITFFILRNFQ